ncbi:endochitinase A isoform X3 [Hyalella azteca]|uniref:Endochitinase A isoform X3 n=1 Tax=Hyalella azteca TaxID=294128 RepID=A0A979FTP3_HYAAZ|nr:endochitinase A isoform X3 [Hyalella azteca]
MSKVGYIVIIKRSGKDGDAFPMCQETCIIGNHIQSDIRVQLDTVSVRHASIDVLSDSQCVLQSLSAANPVKVNNSPLKKNCKHVLVHKDVITVGDRLLRWEYAKSSPHHPDSATTFVFSTPTRLAGLNTSRKTASSASAKKRKAAPCGELDSPAGRNKRVSFGPYLSPEQFDKQLPSSTPVRKGEKPNFASPIKLASPSVFAVHQRVQATRVKASPYVATNKVLEETPSKSLLRRRSPTPIKPYLARSLGFSVPSGTPKKAVIKSPKASPAASRSSKTPSKLSKNSPSRSVKATSSKGSTPSLILKQKKLVEILPSSKSATSKRSRSESPQGYKTSRSSQKKSISTVRSKSLVRSTGFTASQTKSGRKSFPGSRLPSSEAIKTKSPSTVATPKKRRESSFTVTPKISPSKSPVRSTSASKTKSASFVVTPKRDSRAFSPRSLTKSPGSPKEKSMSSPLSKSPVAKKSPASSGKKSPKSSVKKSRLSLVEKSPKSSVKKSPISSVKKSLPSPVKKSPKSPVKKSSPSSMKKSPKSPNNTNQTLPAKRNSTSPATKTPKSSVKKTLQLSISVARGTSSKKIRLLSKTSPKVPDAKQKSASKAAVLARKTPRVAWARGSFASVLKRGSSTTTRSSSNQTVTARRALQAVEKARKFKSRKNKALNTRAGHSGATGLDKEIPKNFNFGSSSTGHANSPAPIIIYGKVSKTPLVFRKGRKSLGRNFDTAESLDLTGIEVLMASPAKPTGQTPTAATKSPSLIQTPSEKMTCSPKIAAMSSTSQSVSISVANSTGFQPADSTDQVATELPTIADANVTSSATRSTRATNARESTTNEGSPNATPKTAIITQKIMKTPKSANSNLRMMKSIFVAPRLVQSASKVTTSSSLQQTLQSMETAVMSASSLSSISNQSGSVSPVSSISRTSYNSAKHINSPLFMPSLAGNGSRLGDFTSRKSLGIQQSEPLMKSARRTRSMDGSSTELTPSQLRKLFEANSSSNSLMKRPLANTSLSNTSSPSSRCSSRLDMTCRGTPNITQDRFISPLGTPHYTQPDAMLMSSLAAKRTPSSPAAASPSITTPGSNVAIVSPMQRMTDACESQSSNNVSGIKQLFDGSKTPGVDYRNVRGVKQLLRSSNTPKDDLRNVSGVRSLMKKRSPQADYTNVQNIKSLFSKNPYVSLSDSTLESLGALMKSPISSDTTLEIHEVLNVVTSPPKSNAITRMSVTTNKPHEASPHNVPDVIDISGEDDDSRIDTSGSSRSKNLIPSNSAHGTKRSAPDESPVTRNTRGTRAAVAAKKAKMSSQSISQDSNLSPLISNKHTRTSTSSPLVKTASMSLGKNPEKSPLAKTPAKPLRLSKTPAISPLAKTHSTSPLITTPENPAKSPLAKSPTLEFCKTPAKSSLVTTPAKSSSVTPSEVLNVTSPVASLPRRRGRPRANAALATPTVNDTSPLTTIKENSSKETRRRRLGRKAASPGKDTSTSVEKNIPVASRVTRRGRGVASKLASPVADSPQVQKSPAPVKRSTRSRKAVLTSPVKKTSPAKDSPAKIGNKKLSAKETCEEEGNKSPETAVKRTRRGIKKALTSEISLSTNKAEVAIVTAATVDENKPKRATRGRQQAKVTASEMTLKATPEIIKKPARKSKKSDQLETEEVSTSLAEAVAVKSSRGAKASKKKASPKSSKTPSPARPIRQTRSRAAKK